MAEEEAVQHATKRTNVIVGTIHVLHRATTVLCAGQAVVELTIVVGALSHGHVKHRPLGVQR